MSKLRLLAPLTLIGALAVAACGTTGTSGSPAASAPAASPSAAESAAASASAEASAPASAEASASAAASADAGGGDLAAMIPATVGDIAMSVTITDGENYVKANVNRQLAPILTAIGKTPTDVTVATATGSAGGATLFIDAVQVTGADTAAMMTAFQTAATAVPGTTVEAADVGGKSVVKATTSSYTLAVYASGDTLFYVQSPDPELVDQAIAALP